jgi:hypothetical protein
LPPEEQWGRRGVFDLLDQVTLNTPLAAGAKAVLSAPDRDAFLAAIASYPELLTDKGNQIFEFAAVWSVLLGVPPVTEWIRRGQAAVQAVREARA